MLPLSGEPSHEAVPRIIGQQQRVGELQRGVLPQGHPGREPVEIHPLRGPHRRAGVLLIVVGLQIHRTQQAPPHLTAPQRPLHIDHGGGQPAETLLPQIVGHGIVDLHDVRLHIGPVQTTLREDQPQGGGGAAHKVLHPLPVFRLRGVLIAGHHRPFMLGTVPGQQNVRAPEGHMRIRWHHGSPLLSGAGRPIALRIPASSSS